MDVLNRPRCMSVTRLQNTPKTLKIIATLYGEGVCLSPLCISLFQVARYCAFAKVNCYRYDLKWHCFENDHFGKELFFEHVCLRFCFEKTLCASCCDYFACTMVLWNITATSTFYLVRTISSYMSVTMDKISVLYVSVITNMDVLLVIACLC